jgi:hypothetical protein
MTPTPRIIQSINTLRSGRFTTLRDLFSPISKRGKHINIYPISLGGSFIIGISDGKETGSNFREWRFQTTNENIRGCYFEVWLKYEKENCFLERSYLHLYKTTEPENENEYVLLHCDASEPDGTEHAIYKQSPHLHIEVAPYPLKKAHIALYNGRIGEVLKNIGSFNDALRESIQMINSQILLFE